MPGLVALFLPYHNTPHFPSALNLIAESTMTGTAFAGLLPAKKSLAPVDLTAVVDLLPPFDAAPTARPLLDFILHLPLSYLEHGETPHRALTAFWLQAVASYLDRAGTRLPDGERAAVLSTVLEVLRTARAHPDTLIASYILVARFAMHNPFDAETLRVVLKGVVSNRARTHVADDETDAALVTTLVVISQLGEDEVAVPEGKKFLGNSGWKSLLRTAKLDELAIQLSNQYDASRFLKPFLQTLAQESCVRFSPRAHGPLAWTLVLTLARSTGSPPRTAARSSRRPSSLALRPRSTRTPSSPSPSPSSRTSSRRASPPSSALRPPRRASSSSPWRRSTSATRPCGRPSPSSPRRARASRATRRPSRASSRP